MTFTKSEWIRVSKSNHCSQCQKGDWCSYTAEGVVLCMRVPSLKPAKNGGWIHKLDETKKVFIPKFKPTFNPVIDFETIFQSWQKKTEPKALMSFADSLGVEAMALHMIGCAQTPDNAWGMAMRDAKGKIIGIQTRHQYGSKLCVKGSKAGLFFPTDHEPKHPLIITEGCSDCAAALSLGFSAIGRFNCSSQESLVNEFIHLKKIREVVIVSDKDEAGMNGALKLQASLRVKSVIIVTPAKDLREFVSMGGTKKMIESLYRDKIWTCK